MISGAAAASGDAVAMARAMELAGAVRGTTSPNPWVGAVVVKRGEIVGEGATSPPGGAHAEVVALRSAGAAAVGSTLYVTLEPCAHEGRTPPCVRSIVDARVARVVVGIEDPDPLVSGRGIEELRAGGIDVTIGAASGAVTEQLAPYIKHRRTGRPWVILKLAMTADGRIAAPDGSSKWITSEQARSDVQRLRSVSDAVLVGAGTIRKDDPALTVREGRGGGQPERVVLGTIEPAARVMPALELSGDLGSVLDELGTKGVLQVLVEGGATVAHEFHAAGLVDRYVLYVAPALAGGDDSLGLFTGPGAQSVSGFTRGRFVSVEHVGPDIRIEMETT